MKNKLKTLSALLLVVAMTLSFVACGNSKNTDTTDTDNALTNNSTANSLSANDNEAVKLDKFQQFENGLTDKQIEFEIVQKEASMVGAKEGYGYIFNDEASVELYLFDQSSDAYKEAVKNNKIYLESFDIEIGVVFNDDVCIFYNGESANKADIEEIFESLK